LAAYLGKQERPAALRAPQANIQRLGVKIDQDETVL
jgi:hypothetical protein